MWQLRLAGARNMVPKPLGASAARSHHTLNHETSETKNFKEFLHALPAGRAMAGLEASRADVQHAELP